MRSQGMLVSLLVSLLVVLTLLTGCSEDDPVPGDADDVGSSTDRARHGPDDTDATDGG